MLQNSNKLVTLQDSNKQHNGERRDSGGAVKPVTKPLSVSIESKSRKDSTGSTGTPPQNTGERKSSTTVDPVFEKRRSSFSADALPSPTRRRGSVDIFEGLPLSRRGSISPLAPKLEPPTINQVENSVPDHIILQCRITSDTKPEVSWSHLDDRIKNDNRHYMYVEKDGDGWMASLEIRDIIRKDAGKYSVRARNAAGENYATVFSYIE